MPERTSGFPRMSAFSKILERTSRVLRCESLLGGISVISYVIAVREHHVLSRNSNETYNTFEREEGGGSEEKVVNVQRNSVFRECVDVMPTLFPTIVTLKEPTIMELEIS